jgi:hypothetical protein
MRYGSVRVRREPSALATLVGVATLLVGTLAYLTLRTGGTAAFPVGLGLGAPAFVAGSLPAFVHTFAFALLSAVAIGLDRGTLAWSAGAWALFGGAFEALQHERVAAALLPHPATLSHDGAIGAATALLARYAHLGVFDAVDLATTALGALAAWRFGATLLARSGRASGSAS